jgi:hypothetical protein
MDLYEHGSDAGSVMSSRSAAGNGDFMEQLRTSVRNATSEITSSFYSVTERVSSFTSQAQSFINNYVEQTYTTKKMKASNYWETRDMYPRMGWHDVQAVVSGNAARDVASHFVQVNTEINFLSFIFLFFSSDGIIIVYLSQITVNLF